MSWQLIEVGGLVGMVVLTFRADSSSGISLVDYFVMLVGLTGDRAGFGWLLVVHNSR